MAVKYVKDFIFGPMTSVQRYAKGGHVTKVPAKAKDSAKGMPARAKPNAPAKGAKRMESAPKMGKGQGYKDGGKVPGKKMDRQPTKTPPGRDKDLAPAKPFKGAYEGYNKGGKARRYAEGGETDGDTRAARIMPGDGSPLDAGVRYNRYGEADPYGDRPVRDITLEPYRPIPVDETIGEAQPVYEPPQVRYSRGLDGPVDSLKLLEPGPVAPTYDPRKDLASYDLIPDPGYGIPISDEYNIDRRTGMPIMRPEEAPMARAVREAGAGRDVGLSDIMRAARAQGMMGRPGMFSPQAMYAKGGKVSKGQAKVGKVMGEYKRGELHSGSKKGPLVKNPKQAVAIALSEARKSGAKIAKKAEGGLSDKELGGKSFAGRNEPLRGRYVSREEKIMREAVAKEKQKDMERKMREAYERTQSQSVSGLKKGGMARKGVPAHKAKAMYGGGKC